MRICFNTIKYPAAALFTSFTLSSAAQSVIRTPARANIDTYEKTQSGSQNPVDKYTQEDLPAVFREAVNPSGRTNEPQILKNAPSPAFKLMNKDTNAALVVDITNCMVYRYNDKGKPIEAFKAATGKASTPTKTGVAKIIAILNYPYKTSPPKSKRRRHPRDYGPKIILMYKVDTTTGELHDDGRYTHGTRFENAIEKGHITHGCTRVHNRDILYLADVLEKGMYVIFKK